MLEIYGVFMVSQETFLGLRYSSWTDREGLVIASNRMKKGHETLGYILEGRSLI